MPRKLPIPFTGSSTMAQPERTAERRPSQSKGNRLSQFFSSSPKAKEQPSTHHTLMAMQSNGPPSVTASSLLPSISLSTATAGESVHDESSTSIFQPADSTEISLQKRRD